MAVGPGFHVDSQGNLHIGSTRETFDSTTLSEAPFSVTKAGVLKATSGSFTGDISGASGTFTGNLSGSTITGGSINIGSGTFQVDSSGNLTATSASISGVISAGGAAADINNNSTTIDGGKITANSISGDTISGGTITGTTINAGTITTGELNLSSLTVSGEISGSRISGGTIDGSTLSGGFISGGSINVGNGLAADSGGMTAIGAVTIAPSTSSQIGNTSFALLAGVSVESSTFKNGNSRFHIPSSSDSLFLVRNSTTKFESQNIENTTHDDLRPETDNSFDLGSSLRRFDDVFATNTTIQTSDITLKENIETTDLGLDFVNDLTPIEFTWKDGGVRTHLGFSAQDIKEKLITHKGSDQNMAVYTQGSYEPYYERTEEDDDGFSTLIEVEDHDKERFGLRMSELIPVLTKAIQELSAKNDELESRLAVLEG